VEHRPAPEASSSFPKATPNFDGVIAVTGGSGRVGRALRSFLSAHVEHISVIDLLEPDDLRQNETWLNVDITDYGSVARSLAKADAIVHLAGFPNERSIEDVLRVNVLGTHNVYEAARHLGIRRIILGSSNHVTGFYEVDRKVDPLDAMRPDSFYGLSKCWNELEAGLYFDKYGIESFIIRIGNATLEPQDPRSDYRSHTIWISPRDLAQLVLLGLSHTNVGCVTVYGASKTENPWWDNQAALDFGYAPLDGIKEVVEPNSAVEETVKVRFQGGRFCAQGHDGIVRARRTRQGLK